MIRNPSASSSAFGIPSNESVISAGAAMARAFGTELKALYVETPSHDKMSEQDRVRLNNNRKLAEKWAPGSLFHTATMLPCRSPNKPGLAAQQKL
jgi:hypothetical protein